MGQADLEASALDTALEEALPFEGLSLDELGQGGQSGHPQRLAHGDQLEESTLVAGEVPEASFDELGQSVRRDQRSHQSPQPSVLDQGPGGDSAEDEFA